MPPSPSPVETQEEDEEKVATERETGEEKEEEVGKNDVETEKEHKELMMNFQRGEEDTEELLEEEQLDGLEQMAMQQDEDMPIPLGLPRPLAPQGWTSKDMSDCAEKAQGFRKDGKKWVLGGGFANGFRV